MKNVFGVNVKTVRGNERNLGVNIDGKPFAVATTDSELTRKQNALQEESLAFQKAAAPMWLKYIVLLSLYGGAICPLIFLRVALENGVENIPASLYLFLGIGLLLMGIWVVSFYSLRKRIKSVKDNSSYQYTEERLKKAIAESRAELGVPDDARQCDVFGYAYKVKRDGKTKPANSNMAEYFTAEVNAFREGDALYLASAQMKLKIPFENIRRFYRVNKRAMTVGWNKPTRFNKGEYKQYKIRSNQYGTLFIKPYYVLELYYQSEDYQIMFPCYEYETFRELLGRDAEI